MQKLLYVPEDGLHGLAGTALTAVRLLIAAFFLFMAWRNLSGDQTMADDFARWGYPDWFRVATGVLQAAGALALIVSPASFLGALLLVLVLLGAITTHVVHDPPATAISAVVFLVVVSGLVIAYRPPLLR